MWKSNLLIVLKLVLILLCTGWISLWLLKPTDRWTRKWKEAEDSTRGTVIGYYGLNFAAYTFPIISVAIIGLVYLNFKARELPRSRHTRRTTSAFSNPLVVNGVLGVLSTMEILAVFLFILFLAWTFYAHISNDFRKLIPAKSMKLDLWQLKYLRVATRFGLLAEACLALLLLPILRGLAVFQLLGIQFEASVRYHIWLGTAMIFFAFFHGASTLFIWGVSHHIQDEVWKWQKTGRIYLAGEIALLAGLVMWITSLPQVRRQKFEVFYYVHHLYIVFLVFFLFHAGDRHFYMVFPGIFLFGLDKLLRIIQSRTETCILSARLFPCKALELVLPKSTGLKYTPTSVIFMKIPSISKFEWHSFSVSSSSSDDDRMMSVIIRCEGRWTSSLYDMIQAPVDSDSNKMKCIPVAIEGPYGPTSMDFLRYESVLLIAGGIGITPFLSILREIAGAQSSYRHRLPTRIQLVFVVKRSQDIFLLNSVSSLLQNNGSQKWHLKVKVFVTQESQPDATVGEILEELPPAQTIHFAQNGPIYAVHGHENYLWRAALVAIASIVFFVLLLCFNHIFIPSKKKGSSSVKRAVSSEKKPPKEDSPSWVADLLIISSFIIALACSSLGAIVLRWRKMKKQIPPVTQKKGKAKEVSSVEPKGAVEEHQVHFGGRPNLEDIFTAFANETGGTGIEVLVCGPDTMNEAVAELCRMKSTCFRIGTNSNKKKPFFSYHCLNFTL